MARDRHAEGGVAAIARLEMHHVHYDGPHGDIEVLAPRPIGAKETGVNSHGDGVHLVNRHLAARNQALRAAQTERLINCVNHRVARFGPGRETVGSGAGEHPFLRGDMGGFEVGMCDYKRGAGFDGTDFVGVGGRAGCGMIFHVKFLRDFGVEHAAFTSYGFGRRVRFSPLH